MPSPAIRRILIEAYLVGSRELDSANAKLVERPVSIAQVAEQEEAVAALESAVRKLRSAVDAAKDLL